MHCKTHYNGTSQVLACADKELIGKTFTWNEIEFTVEGHFYSGKITSEKKFLELAKESGSLNLAGKKAIGLALKHGFLNEKDIIRIGSIEHAVILKV